jgi:hypothetical protein
MVEKDEFIRLSKDWRSAVVLLPTFGLTLLKYLTFGIVAGCVVAIACQTRQPTRGGKTASPSSRPQQNTRRCLTEGRNLFRPDLSGDPKQQYDRNIAFPRLDLSDVALGNAGSVRELPARHVADRPHRAEAIS